MNQKIQLLFLCTGNSCRSQMAEGLCRHYRSNEITACSAGIEKHGLNPLAVQVMNEIDIDISSHHSKTMQEIDTVNLDYVVTVCDHADETCPSLSGNTVKVHHQFDDPPKLARKASSESEALGYYRRVRDEIKEYILNLPMALEVS